MYEYSGIKITFLAVVLFLFINIKIYYITCIENTPFIIHKNLFYKTNKLMPFRKIKMPTSISGFGQTS